VQVKNSLEFSASSFFQEKDEGLRQETISIETGNILKMERLNFLTCQPVLLFHNFLKRSVILLKAKLSGLNQLNKKERRSHTKRKRLPFNKDNPGTISKRLNSC